MRTRDLAHRAAQLFCIGEVDGRDLRDGLRGNVVGIDLGVQGDAREDAELGTSVKAIEAENNLSTTKIKVGEKLKIPAKAEVAAPVAAPAPVAPASEPPTAPVQTTPAPAPGPSAPAAPSGT